MSLLPIGDLRLPFIPQILGFATGFVKFVALKQEDFNWYNH
jgi:hypothetical protein